MRGAKKRPRRVRAATLGVKIQDVALQRALSKNSDELGAYDCMLRARRYTWTLSAEVFNIEHTAAVSPTYHHRARRRYHLRP